MPGSAWFWVLLLLTWIPSANAWGQVEPRTRDLQHTSAPCSVEPARCAEQALRAWLESEYSDVEVQPRKTISESIKLRSGESAHVRTPNGSGLPTRRMIVWLDIRSNDRVSRSLPIEFEVHAHSLAWQSTEDIRLNPSPLNTALLRLAAVDITTLDVVPWSGQADGYRLRKPLLKGQVLTATHVERVTAVTRGQRVDVRASAGEFRVDAQAQALQDGQVGDLIQVRVARSAAAVAGRVVDPGVVEVAW